MQHSGQKAKQCLSGILHNMPCSWPGPAKLPETQLHYLAYLNVTFVVVPLFSAKLRLRLQAEIPTSANLRETCASSPESSSEPPAASAATFPGTRQKAYYVGQFHLAYLVTVLTYVITMVISPVT